MFAITANAYQGRVLPIGGVKEKVLAARRVGINEVILPKQNAKNVKEDFSEDLRRDMRFHLVSEIHEVLAIALNPLPEVTAGDVTGEVPAVAHAGQ